VLQRQWEVSREYAMFATPVGYLIDEQGSIAADVATGVDAILALLSDADTSIGVTQLGTTAGRRQAQLGRGSGPTA